MKNIPQSIKNILLVSFGGLVSIVLIVFIQKKINQVYQDNIPLIALTDRIKNKTTKGHLWFEEYMSGDNSVDPQRDVISLLEDSKTLLNKCIEGGESETGIIVKVEDIHTIDLIATAQKHISEFIEATNQRQQYKIKMTTDTSLVGTIGEGAGSDADQKFDATYELIQNDMEHLAIVIKAQIDEDIKKINLWGWAIVINQIMIFWGIGNILFKTQRKSEKDVADQNQKLADDKRKFTALTHFAKEIGEGNYASVLNLDEKDELSQSLEEMRDKLKLVTEEDRRRDWINKGIAQISVSVRNTHENLAVYYDNLLRDIVNYVGVIQGGIYMVTESKNTEDSYIELVACIAYNRKKHVTKKMLIGEGLIGKVILEKEYIMLTEIPENYLTITSGLGEANPQCILIVPLKLDDSVLGVMEFASFEKVPQYRIDFILKLSEIVASAVFAMQTTVDVQNLLAQSQQQSEELRSQEEEMRQNMEELVATQEELQRKEAGYVKTILAYKEKYGDIEVKS